jgi:homoserine dehydrogenase
VGAGSLGRAVLRYLRDYGGPVQLVGVVTARHGGRIDRDGLDPSLALNLVESDGLGTDVPEEFAGMVEACTPDILIECVPQNIRSGEPAIAFLRTALDLGINAVTANKAAIVLGYRDLLHRAAKTGTQFRFEATVLDGLPLFSTMSHMRGMGIRRVRGVVNATSSLVLESLQNGSTRSRGLARAQAQGIAEADVVLDLDGWDAAAKAALLANVWMGGALRIVDVVRTGCEVVKDEDVRSLPEDAKCRLVVEVVKDEAGVRAKVEPVTIEMNDPFFPVAGGMGAITIETTTGFTYTMAQNTHGLEDAAMSIVQDCFAISQGAPQV